MRALFVPLFAFALNLPAQEIWEAPVAAQPFDRAPFRPVKVPAWEQ